MIEYNTKRNQLIIREYGRNVQKMVEATLAIKSPQKRDEHARAIIRVMAQLNEARHVGVQKKEKESPDYWHKLWDHLFIMSDYKLKVDCPFPKPEPVQKKKSIAKPDYNKHQIRFRTYGRNMENIIKAAALYPEKQRAEIAKSLANHLKMLYLTYNRNSVDDNLIARQLSELSDGKLTLPENFTFTTTHELLQNVNTSTDNSYTCNPTRKKKKKKKKRNNSSAGL